MRVSTEKARSRKRRLGTGYVWGILKRTFTAMREVVGRRRDAQAAAQTLRSTAKRKRAAAEP